MRSLSAQDIIGIWEDGYPRTPSGQALAILARACPELTADERDSLSIGERDSRLLAARERTFGPQLDGFAECPRCRESLEFSLHAPDLRATPAGGAGAEEHTLVVRGYEVRFRLLTSGDLAAAADCPDVESARRLLVRRCVLSAHQNGREIAPEELPETLLQQLASHLAECDPQAEVVLDLACPACGHRWPAIFDVGTFFWTELSAQARRLLREVHRLALAYGWSEGDILAMSGRRRQSYLEMVGV